ncbi:amidohydrolase family protein [Pollutibacter soli]|uniref:amidohydrolase family protein n=1 Tax=Pollutibacter soli TaxID=3034157 RepID=UPI0030136CD9
MKITTITAKLILAFCLSFAIVRAQDKSPDRIAVTAKRMIDVRTGKEITDAVILVEKNRITGVGSNLRIPDSAQIIALGDVTLLPGLIDAHTHLLHQYYSKYGDDNSNRILEMTQLGPAKRAMLGVRLAREMLDAGFTSVRDLGNSSVNADIALRDAINSNDVAGPRMFVSTRALSPVGGQFQSVTPEAQHLLNQEYVQISGTEEARRAVRQAIYDGADCIKVIVNSGSRRLSVEEIKVIVEEAKRANLPVAAHATDGDGPSMIAAEAGVSSIEHAYTISETVLALMAKKNIFLVPTDAAGVAKYQERIKRALKAGVRIAIGSDIYYEFSGMTRGQVSVGMYKTYLASGMTSIEILRAATINPAELIGNNSIGSLEVGRFADIIAVKGNPLTDISVLEGVVFVMKDGKVYKK